MFRQLDFWEPNFVQWVLTFPEGYVIGESQNPRYCPLALFGLTMIVGEHGSEDYGLTVLMTKKQYLIQNDKTGDASGMFSNRAWMNRFIEKTDALGVNISITREMALEFLGVQI